MSLGEWLYATCMALFFVGFIVLKLRRPRPITRTKLVTATTANLESLAHRAGREDVFDGWIEWAAAMTPAEVEAQRKTYDQWSADERRIAKERIELDAITAKAAGGIYRTPSPMLDDRESLTAMLEQHPRAEWGLGYLREHMRHLQAHKRTRTDRHHQINTRLRLTAAIVNDLREETYNPGTAKATAPWAYHEHPAVRASYLAGRGKGVEDIMDAVTDARARAREVGEASLSLESASERHAAALRALRETNPSTEARDAHAQWEAEQRAITGDDQTTP